MDKTTVKKNRDIRFDFVKLFTIFLVILGHILPLLNKEYGYSHHLRKVIYSFHMPLFMILSGFFSSSSLSLCFYSLVQKKIRQLILPAISCTILVCVAAYFLLYDFSYRDEVIGNSWFLKTLFVVYIIAWPIKHFAIGEEIYALFSIIILFFIPHSYSLQINYLYPFFLIGYFLHKYRIFEFLEEKKYRCRVLFMFFISYCILYLFHDSDYIPITYNNLHNHMTQILLKYLVAITGSMTIILLILQLFNFKKESSLIVQLSNYGKYTLGIYVVQSFFVDFIIKNVCSIYINDISFFYLNSIIASLIILFFCIIMIKGMSRYKVLDYLLFGGQYYKL